MNSYSVHIFDLDGVIYLGNTAIPHAIEYLNHLSIKGDKVYFFTNNSSKTRLSVAEKISKLGYTTNEEQIISSSSIANEYFATKNYKSAFLFGELGARNALFDNGIQIINDSIPLETILDNDSIKCDIVLAGIFRTATYSHVAAASLLLQRGAKFIVTNTDPSIPIERGLFPGAGAMIKAIETASGIVPEIIFGKPSPIGILSLISNLNLPETNFIMYGDRMDTDILCGYNANISTALMLTGAMTREDANSYPFKPTYIYNNFLECMQ
ncbi:MAG: HAD-IIA family hydrolase [Fusobacteria bacterium]|nr:HAD-IIA family hydrolase [Fusobacteriota bacterium]